MNVARIWCAVKIWDLADLPEQRHIQGVVRVAGELSQGRLVVGALHRSQTGMGGPSPEAFVKSGE